MSSTAEEASRMLDLFASVGATSFDITHIHITGEKRGFRKDRPLQEVKRSMPYLVASAVRRQNNVIVRPRVPGLLCIQLDDLDGDKVRRIAPAAFLTLKTSPGSFQSWVTMPEAPIGTTSRLRRGIDADLHASGATRVAGTLNFKLKYAPMFPTVRIIDAQPGRQVTLRDLQMLGVLAPEFTIVHNVTKFENNLRKPSNKWPSYQRCLDAAPLGANGRPHRTRVDFTWCLIASSWGHNVEAVSRKLLEVSAKAAENGQKYALQTAERSMMAARQRCHD